jgi:membrane-bound serine protease (ClpP class)
MEYVILFFAMGMAAIFLEFFIPGGALGAIGGCLLAVGVYFAYDQWGTSGLILGASVAIILGAASLIASMHIIPRTRLGRKLIQEESTSGEKGYNAADVSLRELEGKEGVTLTALRPAGIALIDEKRIDVVSANFMIARGVKVKVIQVEGNRVVVDEIPSGADAARQ